MPAWSRLARHQGGQAYFHPRVCAEVFSPSDRVQRAPWGSGRCTSWRIAEIHRLSKKGGVEKLNRFAYILPRQLVQDEPRGPRQRTVSIRAWESHGFLPYGHSSGVTGMSRP